MTCDTFKGLIYLDVYLRDPRQRAVGLAVSMTLCISIGMLSDCKDAVGARWIVQCDDRPRVQRLLLVNLYTDLTMAQEKSLMLDEYLLILVR